MDSYFGTKKWRKDSSVNKCIWKTGLPLTEIDITTMKKLDPCLTPYTEVNSKVIKISGLNRNPLRKIHQKVPGFGPQVYFQ